MGLRVEIQRAAPECTGPPAAAIVRWAQAAYLETGDAGVVIRIVDVPESATLNHRYRHREGPTNVLSFPFEVPPGVNSDHLGDVVICAPVVEAEADLQSKNADAHWAHMVIHGTLHLQGFDHEDKVSARDMEDAETRILEGLGYPAPYEQQS